MGLKVFTLAQFLAVIGGSIAFAQSAEQARARFLAACVVSANSDDPLGSEHRHQAYCRCRLDALAEAHSTDQIDQISALIEDANGGVVSRATSPVGADLAVAEATASACQRVLRDE